MSFFSNTATRRRAVFTVLLVWLFALGSGWANACRLQDSHTYLSESSDDPSSVVHVSAGHVDLDSDHPGNANAAKSVCLKVCDDGTQTIVKLASSGDLTDVAMAPPTTFSWSARQLAMAPAKRWLDLPAPSPPLPLRTRFSRLAL